MEEELIAPGDQSAGSVEMSIIYYHEHARINAGSIVAILTFGFGALLGIPYATTVINVETEAKFFDQQQDVLATHRGVGRGKKLQSL